jgi:hypothetical protein
MKKELAVKSSNPSISGRVSAERLCSTVTDSSSKSIVPKALQEELSLSQRVVYEVHRLSNTFRVKSTLGSK